VLSWRVRHHEPRLAGPRARAWGRDGPEAPCCGPGGPAPLPSCRGVCGGTPGPPYVRYRRAARPQAGAGVWNFPAGRL